MQPEQQQRIMGYFIEESKDHLNTIEQGLLNLQNTIGDSEMVNEVFRAAHSIKGGAAMLGISSVQKTAHRLEDCFKVLQESPVKVDEKLESLFLQVFDTLHSLIEQLTTPFGLTDETAKGIMSGTDPVFEELHNHLQHLLQDTGTYSPIISESVTDATLTTAKNVNKDRKALAETFQAQVLADLREMLQMFKQPDNASNRQQLQEICQRMANLGEPLGLTKWSELLLTSSAAIANPENSARTLAAIVIKEIKQAQELVLAGNQAEILPSKQLKTLLPPVLSKSNASADFANSVDFGLKTSAGEKLELIESKAKANSSKAKNQKPTNQPDSASNTAATKNAGISSRTFKETKSLAMSFPPPPKQRNSGKSNAHNRPAADPNGPEMGMPELNSLAELFDLEASELDATWKEEEIVSTNTGQETDSLLSLNLDSQSEFSELLSEEEKENQLSALATESNDDFINLFGDDMKSEPGVGKDESRNIKNENIHTDATKANTLEDDFSDLLFDADSSDLLGIGSTPEEDLASLFGDDSWLEAELEQQEIADYLDFSIDADTTPVSEQNDDQLLEILTAEDVNEALSAATASPDAFNITADVEESLSDWFTDLDEKDSLFTEDKSESISRSGAVVGGEEKSTNQQPLANNHQEVDTLLSNKTPELTPENSESEWQDLVFEEDPFAKLEDESGYSSLFFDETATVDQTDLASNDILMMDGSPEGTPDLLMPLDFELASSAGEEAKVSAPQEQSNELKTDDLEFILPVDNTAIDALNWDDTSEDSLDASATNLGADAIDTESAGLMPSEVEEEDSWDLSSAFDENSVEQQLLELDEGSTTDSEKVNSDVSLVEDEELFANDEENAVDFDALDDLFEEEPEAIASSANSPLDLSPDETSQVNPEDTQNLEALFDAEIPVATNALELTPVPPEAAEKLEALFDADTPVAIAALELDEDLFAPETSDEGWTLDADTDLTTDAYADLLELETADSLGTPADSDAEADLKEFLATGESEAFGDDSYSEGEDNDLGFAFNSSDSSSDFDELESMLGEAEMVPTSEIADSSADFDELESMLGEAEMVPTSEIADSSADFDELESMLGEAEMVPASEIADSSADFDELESLLGEVGMVPASSQSAETNDFDDLEDLLNQGSTNESSVTQTTKSGVKNAAPATESVDDDFDDLEKLLQQADKTMGGQPTAKPNAGPGTRRPRVFEQTTKVPVKHLDSLSNLVGELVVNRNSLEQDQERMRHFLDNLLNQVQQLSDVGSRMQDLYERSLLESSLLASRQNSRLLSNKSAGSSSNNNSSGIDFDPLELDQFSPIHSLSQEMIELIVRVRESASDIEFLVEETDQVARMLRQITTQLQEGLTRSRMEPFAQTVDKMQRAVRDNALKYGKQVELHIDGRETLIDKVILEHLSSPLTHMVNNAIAHGIETPQERIAAGKPPVGRITIQAFHQGNQTVIGVSDDGAGINAERVKAKAIKMGLIKPADAKTMSKPEVYDLLFHPGFSIKDKADELAGRGVGMDVVRNSLIDIRGTINTESTLGKGTTFTIRLPLTLSICKALCCVSDKASIAFPMDGVEDMLDVPNARIETNNEGKPCIPWRDSYLPFQPLSELLTYNRQISRGTVYGGTREDDMISIVVLRTAGNFIAIEVDKVVGEQEIVIKQVQGPVPKPVGIAGATVLGDGRIMPIADVLELIDLARGVIRKDIGNGGWPSVQFPAEPIPVKTEPMVLIVDDSITVRELLSMTFNKAGYRVEQARDGQEAWDKLRSGLPCDIIFCDIEMPRMDGLELLSRIQKDESLNHLPVAMLTSRGATRHQQMAADLGASGYFTKPYLEEALLDAAQRMMKGEVLLNVASNA
jgi:chemotaxis protein histidine kinase CheA/ActR/RegA family two-component response regulator